MKNIPESEQNADYFEIHIYLSCTSNFIYSSNQLSNTDTVRPDNTGQRFLYPNITTNPLFF